MLATQRGRFSEGRAHDCLSRIRRHVPLQPQQRCPASLFTGGSIAVRLLYRQRYEARGDCGVVTVVVSFEAFAWTHTYALRVCPIRSRLSQNLGGLTTYVQSEQKPEEKNIQKNRTQRLLSQ
eukprot:2397863-Amphidinium_carterae.1